MKSLLIPEKSTRKLSCVRARSLIIDRPRVKLSRVPGILRISEVGFVFVTRKRRYKVSINPVECRYRISLGNFDVKSQVSKLAGYRVVLAGFRGCIGFHRPRESVTLSPVINPITFVLVPRGLETLAHRLADHSAKRSSINRHFIPSFKYF